MTARRWPGVLALVWTTAVPAAYYDENASYYAGKFAVFGRFPLGGG